MLDNFDGPGLQTAAMNIRRRWNLGSISQSLSNKVLLECSGGLTEENVKDYICSGIPPPTILTFAPDIDVYSTSSVHQSTQHVDYSLKVIQRR